MAKKPVKTKTRAKLSIPEQPVSKGQLVPSKPTSRVPSIGRGIGMLGKLAKGVARKNPLIDIIFQNFPGPDQVSENIKGAMDDALQEEQTRREFLIKAFRGAGKMAAGAAIDKGALIDALLGGDELGGILDDDIPGLMSIEERILQDLVNARGNQVERAKVIRAAVEELKLDMTAIPVLSNIDDTVFIVDEFPLEADALSQHLDNTLGQTEDPYGFEGTNGVGNLELENEVLDDMQTGKEITDQNRIEQGIANFSDTPEQDLIKRGQDPRQIEEQRIMRGDRETRNQAVALSQQLDKHFDDIDREDAVTEEEFINIEQRVSPGEDELMGELTRQFDPTSVANKKEFEFQRDQARLADKLGSKGKKEIMRGKTPLERKVVERFTEDGYDPNDIFGDDDIPF